MKAQYKKLVKNTFIFGLGSFGSKALQFILLPMYSYTLTTKEYGIVDFLNSLIQLLVPLITLDLIDGAFRFSLDKNANKKGILSYSFVVVSIGAFIASIILYILNIYVPSYHFLIATWLLVVNIYYSLFSNFIRANGQTISYAISGIITTIVSSIFSIVFLVYFHLGIVGYLLSLIIGLFSSIIYLFFSGHLWCFLNYSEFKNYNGKELFKYSVPLIPNYIAWWFNSASDRFFIIALLDTFSNGIYAMANKLPSIINIIFSFFMQAWQISVVEEFEKSSKKEFISRMANIIFSILFIITILCSMFAKILFVAFIDKNYLVAWKIVPVLSLTAVVSCISSYLGTIYTASKETKKVMHTTVIGAVLNILFSLLLIKLLGILGAGLANLFSFSIVSILRYLDLKKKDIININPIKLCLQLMIVIVSIILIRMVDVVTTQIIIGAISIAFILFVSNDVIQIMGEVYKKLK